IESIAARTDESPRRVRARLEKEGFQDLLMTQILERKALARVLEFATVENEAMDLSTAEVAVETLDETFAAGSEAESPAEAATAED
ncbi:MAG: trigger factor, partial [Planctomycetota bacterium]|nr:trigger factor [Planctomycetota bacterium]